MKKLQQGRRLAQLLRLLSWWILLLLLLLLLLFLQPVVCRIALGNVVAVSPGSSVGSNAVAIGVVFSICDGDGDDVAPDVDFLEKLNVSLLLGIDRRSSVFISRRRSDGGGGRSSLRDFVFGAERENNGVVMQCCEFISGNVVANCGTDTGRWNTSVDNGNVVGGEKINVSAAPSRGGDGFVGSSRAAVLHEWEEMQQQQRRRCSRVAFVDLGKMMQQDLRKVAECLGKKLVRHCATVDERGPDLAVAVGLCCGDAVSAGRGWMEAPGSSKSDHYIRGFPNPVADQAASEAVTTWQWELVHVAMEERSVEGAGAAPSVKATQKQPFQSSMSLQQNPSSLKSPCIHASPATKFHLSRRSLQAQNGQAAAASYLECRRGHLWLGCEWWENQVVGALVCIAGVLMLVIACAHSARDNATHADFLDSIASLPPRFSYTKLQKSTKNFSRKLGDGAFGSVYEGFLPNGLRVAVKMLDKTSVQGEKQFRAEVASMGAIRHLNLVRLHGFCSEGSHRLLVYEFMANGSLDSWLFGKKHGEKILDWEQRLNIALGTARALAYLHEECSDHIIHLDVKPENILLDHQFSPKLSDFGLAKLMDKEQSRVVTSMRGTPGYLAPEWLLPQAAVTAKTDVYSFGMVLLELISGRENTNFSLGKEQWYFPAWAFKLVGEGRTMELLDKRLHVEEVEYFHKDNALRAIHTALLCIQDDPVLRPSMSRVVHMLQGHVEPEPLNAQQQAIQPPRRLLSAFTASRSDMKADDVQYKPVAPTVPSSGLALLPQPAPAKLQPLTPREMDTGTNHGTDKMSPLPPAAPSSYHVNQTFGNKQRIVQAHAVDTGQNSIPPWLVKGDVILFRGPGGDLYGVVREVRVQTKQMRLALLHRLGSELRWTVWEEENLWRHWNESVKTLDFWVVVRWSTIPGHGIEKFPVEWMAR